MLEAVMRALEKSGNSELRLHAVFQAHCGIFAMATGQNEKAAAALHASLDMFASLGESGESAITLNALGSLAVRTGDTSTAQSCFKRSLRICAESGDEVTAAHTLNQLGWMISCSLWGDIDAAIAYQHQSLELCRNNKLFRRAAYVLEDLGTCHLKLGKDLQRDAIKYYEESLSMFRALGDQLGVAKALNGLGAAHLEIDASQLMLSVNYARESIAILRMIGHRNQLALHLIMIGWTFVDNGMLDDAQSSLTEALAICVEINNTLEAAYAHLYLGKLDIARGRFLDAKEWLRLAVQIFGVAQLEAYACWAALCWASAAVGEAQAAPGSNDTALLAGLLEMLDFVVSRPSVPRKDIAAEGAPLIAWLESMLPEILVTEAHVCCATLNLAALTGRFGADAPERS